MVGRVSTWNAGSMTGAPASATMWGGCSEQRVQQPSLQNDLVLYQAWGESLENESTIAYFGCGLGGDAIGW